MHLNCDSLKNLKIFNFEGSGKYSSSYYNVIFLGILWRQLLPRKTRQEIAIAHHFSLDLITIFSNFNQIFVSDILTKTRLFQTKIFRKIFEYFEINWEITFPSRIFFAPNSLILAQKYFNG